MKTLYCPKCGDKGVHSYNRYVLVAGRRGGKTRIGTLACILELSYPKTYGWICAPTYRDLYDFVEPMFFGQLPQKWADEGDWSESNRILTLANGSIAAFRSLEDPEAVRGPGLDFLLMDETAKIASKAWDVARPALADKQGFAIFPTTPKGNDWVKEKLWGAVEKGMPGWWGCRYKTLDNPHMQKSRDLIEEERATMTPEMFRQEYEADFVTFQGAIYGSPLVRPCIADDTTEEGLARIKQFIPNYPDLDPSTLILFGLDPGSDHPFAGVPLAITPRGIVAIGEYEEREKPALVHAQGLQRLTRGLHTRWVCDRSQAQMMLELAQHGIFAQAAEGGPGSVLAGIERVKTWMLSGKLLLIKSKTKRLVDALEAYRWAETERNDGSKGVQEPYKLKDDLCDALRYALWSWPQLPEVEAPSVGRDLSLLDPKSRGEIERMLRHEKGEDDRKVAEGVSEFYGVAEEYEPATVDGFWG